MLQVNVIRDNKEKIVAGLEKKYFANAAQTVEQIIGIWLISSI